MNRLQRKFGRIHSFDPRDYKYTAPKRRVQGRRLWHERTCLDQGSTPKCVAYACGHWAIYPPLVNWQPDLDALYDRAQQLDEWEGEDYDGTSVRGGMKAMQELGMVQEYQWAVDVNSISEMILEHGPVVVGTIWTSGMMRPRGNLIRPTGITVGGHAYLLDGVDTRRGYYRIKNSWGRGWGRRGTTRIRIKDFAALMQFDGEACLAIEKKAA